MPVLTTELSLCLVWIWLIASKASSGRVDMLKFSGARGHTDLALVPVAFRAIEVPKSGMQCGPGRGDRGGRVGNERAKAKRGNLARAAVEL